VSKLLIPHQVLLANTVVFSGYTSPALGAGTYGFWGGTRGPGYAEFGPSVGTEWEVQRVMTRLLWNAGNVGVAASHAPYAAVFTQQLNPATGAGTGPKPIIGHEPFITLPPTLVAIARHESLDNAPQDASFVNTPIIRSGEKLIPGGFTFLSGADQAPDAMYWLIQVEERDAPTL
jgi:hypothetical protein